MVLLRGSRKFYRHLLSDFDEFVCFLFYTVFAFVFSHYIYETFFPTIVKIDKKGKEKSDDEQTVTEVDESQKLVLENGKLKEGSKNRLPGRRNSSRIELINMHPLDSFMYLRSRRSYYPADYTGEAVSDDLIQELLEAAVWAPSHGKTEPYRFWVYDQETIDVWLDHTKSFFRNHPEIYPWKGYYNNFKEFEKDFDKSCDDRWRKASHFIVVGVKMKNEKRKNASWEEISSVAMAIQNMHLHSTCLELACYWSSWYDTFIESKDCVRDILGLNPEEGDMCVGAFIVGKSDKFGKLRMSREDVNSRTIWIPSLKPPPRDTTSSDEDDSFENDA